MFTQVAFREEHRGLGAFALAEVLGFREFLERCNRFGTTAITNHRHGLGNLILGIKRTRKGGH